MGFAQTDSMSSWRTTETDDIKKFVEDAGGEFIVKDAGGDIATQESDIRDLVAAGVDFLVVAPLEDNGLQGALQEAMDNEIPVILVDWPLPVRQELITPQLLCQTFYGRASSVPRP